MTSVVAKHALEPLLDDDEGTVTGVPNGPRHPALHAGLNDDHVVVMVNVGLAGRGLASGDPDEEPETSQEVYRVRVEPPLVLVEVEVDGEKSGRLSIDATALKTILAALP